jgi:hypothetical protein
VNELRNGLPPLPELFKHLPIDDRGYPVPWFVCKVDGKWDFRMASAQKRELAVKERRCWRCGFGLGAELAFVIGPMCAVNRNTSEPACHRACAEFAVQACPFMVRPATRYREANIPAGATKHFGGLPGNPGAACIWITRSFRTYNVPGGWLIRIGAPLEVQWGCEGKRATRAQLLAAMEARLPALQELAAMQGPEAEAALAAQLEQVQAYLPAAVSAVAAP